MSIERKIISILSPTLTIDEMAVANMEDPRMGSNWNMHKVVGAVYPLLQINEYQFNPQEVSSFNLDETGFMPTIRVVVSSTDGVFVSKYFPKDGDPLSVWVRSKVDEFKPIRCDFEITSVNALPSAMPSGDVQTFVIEGVLRVPGIHSEWCKSFGLSSSIETLQKVSEELKVGFASNEVSTNDTMRWICPFISYERFMQDVTQAAYKDDDSFFDCWMDKYYNFNFVNLNNQFGDATDFDEALNIIMKSDDFNRDDVIEKSKSTLILSNFKNFSGTPAFISGYTVLNNAGRIVMDNGYRRFPQYYEPSNPPKSGYRSYFIEPTDSKSVEGKALLKGRPTENFYSKLNRYKWLGIQNSNAHENYLHALVQNWQNGENTRKLMMRVKLAHNNFNIYRGQSIPIVIINDGNQIRQKRTIEENQSESDKISVDKFLSGHYVVLGMTYSWDSDSPFFVQDLILSRREWPAVNK